MKREELMKKLDVGRVGNGTQTYNDVVVTLTKEETLELFKYIEQLEKENQRLEEAIKILKEVVTITKRRNEVNGNYDISCIYALVSYKDIIEEKYELLNRVFESVGEE